MWVESLDILLQKLKTKKFPFHKVRIISGAGQVNLVFSDRVTVSFNFSNNSFFYPNDSNTEAFIGRITLHFYYLHLITLNLS